MIVVFLNNKLITCDTITPLLLELAERYPATRIELYCFETRTYDVIRRNIVLWDVLTRIGRVRLFVGGSRRRSVRRIVGLLTLLRLVLRSLFGNLTFIHFKALNVWPFRLLFIVNRKRTFFFQGSGTGVSESESRVDKITAHRTHSKVAPAASHLVGFSENWRRLSDPPKPGQARLVVTPPFRRAAWYEYLRSNSERYLNGFGLADDREFAVFILSSMDRSKMLAVPDDFPALFEETLEILADEAPDLSIVVKPHPATSRRYLDEQRQIIERSPNRRVVTADLHPLLLASRARFFIANTYSTTFANAALFAVPTIEYSHYGADALEASGGVSMRPEFVTRFIDREPEKLRRAIREFSVSSRPVRDFCANDDPSYDRLLEALAGRLRPEAVGDPDPAPTRERERERHTEFHS